MGNASFASEHRGRTNARRIALAALLAWVTASVAGACGSSPETSGPKSAGGTSATESAGSTGGGGSGGSGGAGLGGMGAGGASAGGGGASAEGGGGNPGASNGAPCSDAASCASGFCVDGVCCEGACAGTCRACASALTGAPEGTCSPVIAGSDPRGDCADEGAPSCGHDGTCDGQGACAVYAVGTECAAQTCSAGVKTLASTCDADGVCQPGGTVSCAPYQCAGDACAGDCVDDSACAAGTFCDTQSGDCVDQKAAGDACAADDQCQSAFCVDGVCCESACDGACMACSSAKTGTADGTCAPVTAGTDPEDECADQGVLTCGDDGSCDGKGACERYAAGTPCGVVTCVGDEVVAAPTCDGAGTCVPGVVQSCAPYACGPSGCAGTCLSDADCAAGSYCDAGACVAKKTNGGACGAAIECTSGFCVDGVCCDMGCGGTCMACTAAKKGSGADGVCGSIAAGTDPDAECAATAKSTCGDDGTCNGSGACRKWVQGTVCKAGSCSSGVEQVPDKCNGSGTCVNGGTQACAPYVCGATACKGSCAGDGDCIAGYYCASGTCAAKKTQGGLCSASAQCTTGFCVDGVCCESACTGTCDSCRKVLTGAPNGTCAPVVDGACVGCGSGKICQNGSCVTAVCQ